MKPKLLFIVNVDWFFVSHRLPLAIAARDDGYDVHLATRFTTRADELRALGFTLHPLAIERGKSGPLTVIGEFLGILRLLASEKPDVVHLVTIKPVLLGGLAARMTHTHGVLAAISGLGTVFLAGGLVARLRRRLVRSLYGLALGHTNLRVVVQNEDDRSIVRLMAALDEKAVVLIPGSGVDTDSFRPPSNLVPSRDDRPIVMFAARLLRDKGVHEFVQAARLLAETEVRQLRPRFVLVGAPDPDNLTSVTEAELKKWKEEGDVEIWGARADMAETLNQADLVVLPSYREGMPKVLLEAAACGKPVVTCDVPGCREAVIPGKTGLLVKVKDAASLANGIGEMLTNPQRMRKMGSDARELALQRFQVSAVVRKHLDLYGELAAPRADSDHITK